MQTGSGSRSGTEACTSSEGHSAYPEGGTRVLKVSQATESDRKCRQKIEGRKAGEKREEGGRSESRNSKINGGLTDVNHE